MLEALDRVLAKGRKSFCNRALCAVVTKLFLCMRLGRSSLCIGRKQGS